VRSRLVATALALAVFALCLSGFSSASPSARLDTSPDPGPAPVEVDGVEVEGKVIERSPDKAGVDDEALPRTGGDHTEAVIIGLALAAVGLVLVDVTHTPPTRTRKVRATSSRRRASRR
jgi:hypothetical protein